MACHGGKALICGRNDGCKQGMRFWYCLLAESKYMAALLSLHTPSIHLLQGPCGASWELEYTIGANLYAGTNMSDAVLLDGYTGNTGSYLGSNACGQTARGTGEARLHSILLLLVSHACCKCITHIVLRRPRKALHHPDADGTACNAPRMRLDRRGLLMS